MANGRFFWGGGGGVSTVPIFFKVADILRDFYNILDWT